MPKVVNMYETRSGAFAVAWDLTIRDVEALSPFVRLAWQEETGWMPTPSGRVVFDRSLGERIAAARPERAVDVDADEVAEIQEVAS